MFSYVASHPRFARDTGRNYDDIAAGKSCANLLRTNITTNFSGCRTMRNVGCHSWCPHNIK